MTKATITTMNATSPLGVPPKPPEAHQPAERVFSNLLQHALNESGLVSKAYSRFHRYSLGNQLFAASQLLSRGLPLSPIASFRGWQDLGRAVRKGEKALTLYMPVTLKRQAKGDQNGTDDADTFTLFKLARNWFSLEQTEGAEVELPPLAIPAWDAGLALVTLDVTEARFSMLNGNVQGYAQGRQIAVNPVALYPHKTRFHELAHVVLGHTAHAECADTLMLSRSLQEVEAEGVAYVLCALLGLPGLPESRDYIQGWLDGGQLPEKSPKRMFSAAQRILAAGQPKAST
ncbi:conserved hypothetical protein [Thiomonas arsenitoxydans]|uniref:N-terminal domain-containing protein n=1 Tax=Thiomonas arsenitoxydans (strain DSM 22701 / CIP 110005 / 3As) TaxID=426114 RepID=D6CQ66_THIA3|nr:ArdC-like ssDNA-binding domain-containing protein [Thiomonas arsenitoxydans]CAZ88146.1 conserved hypothetical protein [Thiomonas arsenitoxydans]CQR32493.1 conserved hypothetical protein [Thiomonas arsenitoxydans]CQR32837.1 conserved hypothetical protein [Thiomonas arsenitoxydans]CQR34169.1 conserved hypothetical protein [Thiomonas arsenitoxydans]CQR40447.1 conserved hypothetical protein [Thiomonas arsenitoxydans]